MIDMPDLVSLRLTLTQPIDARLNGLLSQRLADAIASNVADLTHWLVIQPGDTEKQIMAAIGFSPLTSVIDGERGQPDWDWKVQHEGYWELIYTVGNDGFAFVVLVQDAEGMLPSLLALCRNHTDL